VADPRADELGWAEGVEVEALLRIVLGKDEAAEPAEEPLPYDAVAGVETSDGDGVAGLAAAAGAVGCAPAGWPAAPTGGKGTTGTGTGKTAGDSAGRTGGGAGPVIFAAAASANASW
jgi:hypothetical protein